ncbi:MAG: hypothetical protein AB7E09_06875 [Candidatus Izemoplasmatales bacterium]
MIWIDKKGYKDTYLVMTKQKVIEQTFLELKKFVEEKYGIKIYNVYLQKIERLFNKPLKNTAKYGKKYQLTFQVATMQDRELMQDKVDVDLRLEGYSHAFKMVHNENKQTEIIDEFYRLAKKHNYPIKVNREKVWVDYYYWFSSDFMRLIVEKVFKDIQKNIHLNYNNINIWKIDRSGFGIYIFYDTEINKEIYDNDGTTLKIKEFILDEVKKLDEFNYYDENYIVFDTKEKIDNKYKGNLFIYYRS